MEVDLVLNWEKCHFMVKQGIVLGHVISERGIEVDKAKVEMVEQLPPPTDVKSFRSFLGHVGFYRRFIKDFSKITKPLTQLLQKDVAFDFDEKCLAAFQTLNALVSSPIIQPLLIGKTRMKFRSASVRISYALLHLREIPRFLSTQGARTLLAFNPTLI
jgi:hypothetical protein